MKKQNKDAAGSMSALEIVARAVHLLHSDYSMPVQLANKTTLQHDVFNAQNAIDALRAMQKAAMVRLDVLVNAPFD